MKFKVIDHDYEDEPQEIEASTARAAARKYAQSVYENERQDVTVDCDVIDERGKTQTFSVEFRMEVTINTI